MSGGFTCTRCGAVHPGPALAYAFGAPVHWDAIPKQQRAECGFLGEELCMVDGRHYFVRARIVLPIRDAPGEFEWGVWVSLSRPNWERAREVWQQAGRESEPPYFGWLSNEPPGYPSTLNLKTLVHTRPIGERPTVELEPTDHPLAVEQRQGITLGRVREIAEDAQHGSGLTDPR
jgi:hypothetical protein